MTTEKAIKYDQEKVHGFSLIPTAGLRELAKLFHFGCSKYSPDGWRIGDGLEYRRCYDAIMRHALDWLDGEDYDPESKCHHLVCCAFYCFIIIAYEHSGTDTGKKQDNRWKPRNNETRPFNKKPDIEFVGYQE